MDILTSSFVIMIFLYSGGAYLSGNFDAQQKKTFSIIEDKYTIIYQNSEYYWTVFSEEFNDTLTLDTTKQKIISIDSIEIVLKKFKDINFVYN